MTTKQTVPDTGIGRETISDDRVPDHAAAVSSTGWLTAAT